MKCPKCDTENRPDSKYCRECATSLTGAEEAQPLPTQTIEAPREELTTGSKFAGRYQIIEELGKGGMGKVYKANDTDIKEKVAIKLIKPEISTDKKTIERFQNELKFARKIRHKNVCQMYDLNREDGTYYITMEYVAGQDLKKLIRQTGQLAIGTLINIAKQVCDGLAEAHQLGVVHRDLKPSNIMIDADGNARIMDFGIARSIEGKGITGAGVMIGTPEYMSPEQVEGKDSDQRSDIYSLGVILYEMVTGRVPFEGDTALSIAVKHKTEEPKDPKEHNRQIPNVLSYLILKCLEKDKEKRYQSAKELISALENIERNIPTTEKVVPKKKPITSKEITVTLGLKKILLPVLGVAALITAALIIWSPWKQSESVSIPSDKPSIAVLPFVDMSEQKDQGHLCDGLADELISRLTKIQGLRVPARTSSFSFRGKDVDIKEIGEELNVSTVLEGSLQKAEDKLRVRVRLVNVADSQPIWSEVYARDEEDIFALQDEISLSIVNNLRIKLLGEEETELLKRYTADIEAYNLYLKGRLFWNQRDEENLRKSIKFLQEAIDRDPNYALAYSGVADSYSLLGAFVDSPGEAFLKAKTAAQKALALDENLAEAYTSLGLIKVTYEWDWIGAEKDYTKAIQINPSYPTARHWHALLLARMKRFEEALTEIMQAQELDPLSPVLYSDMGAIYNYSRQPDQAIDESSKALELQPNFEQAYLVKGTAYLLKSMYGEAIAAFEEGLRSSDVEMLHAHLGYAYAVSGNIEKANEILKHLEQSSNQRYISPYSKAVIYIGLGNKELAFEMLESSYDDHNYPLSYLSVWPYFDPIRDDPRFKDLLRRLNFPDKE